MLGICIIGLFAVEKIYTKVFYKCESGHTVTVSADKLNGSDVYFESENDDISGLLRVSYKEMSCALSGIFLSKVDYSEQIKFLGSHEYEIITAASKDSFSYIEVKYIPDEGSDYPAIVKFIGWFDSADTGLMFSYLGDDTEQAEKIFNNLTFSVSY